MGEPRADDRKVLNGILHVPTTGCRSLVEVLGGGRALSLRQIMDGSGFARQTAYNHLRHLVAAGMVSREAVRRGRGRPTILYRLSKPSIEGPSCLTS